MRRGNGQLLDLLPAIYHESDDLASLLAVFESVLFGTEAYGPAERKPRLSVKETWPIVESIAAIPSLFDANETPREFVPWLARWVALADLEGLSEKGQRQLLANIVPLYAQRGTGDYLKKIIAYFIPRGATVEVYDKEMRNFIVGKAKIGSTSRFEQDRPFWFRVHIAVCLPDDDPGAAKKFKFRLEERIRRVIDLAKPAHTLYELNLEVDKDKKTT